MRLPSMRKQSAQLLSLPDLSGGLNMRDGISEVLDNQLTECQNMWWRDGLLQTRAAMIQNDSKINLGSSVDASVPKIRKHNCYNTVSGIKGQLCSTVFNDKINFFWNYGKSISNIASISEKPSNYFVCQYSNMLYCFTNKKNVYKFDVSAADNKWENVSQEEYYIPLIATYCNPNGQLTMKSSEVVSTGTAIEGFNILSDYYKLEYNAYNPEADKLVNGQPTGHPMIYALLDSVTNEKYKNKVVTVKYATGGSTYTHKVTLTGELDVRETEAQGDDLRLRVFGQMVYFLKKDTTSVAIITNEENQKNNIEITAPYIFDNKDKEKIFNMTQCEWFGGSAGLLGGTRLFLCGNTKKGNGDLVVWSGLNNPLYFPENSYFNVGNETGAVTGFGKQSDKLIIFKENETWFTQYNQNTNITANDLINQRVIDYASSSVYFPLTQINSNIGCPYPDTIQLCRNRLVWLGNNNTVYTLTSESQYNERNIYSVSEMVKRKIDEIVVDSKASACDWNGYYCLLLGNKMLLMDYNCYGYTHVASYSKQEDANIRIPWYYWEVSNVQKMTVIGDCLSMVDIINMAERYYVVSYCFDTKGVYDKLFDVATNEYITTEIDSYFTTKIFDFASPHILKNIEQINLQVGNNGGVPIKVFFITENGTEQSEIVTTGNDLTNYTAGYIDSRAVFPCIKQILRFGIKVECKGKLAVDSVILKYRTTGGAR